MRVSEGKLTRGNLKGREDSGSSDLTGFLVKISQGDQMLPQEWW